jgi:hypothetical protein
VKDTGRERAQAFVLFCDGMGEAGYGHYARRGRALAAELLAALDTLDTERAARMALQRRCERLQEIVGKAAYRECIREALRT